MTAVRARCSALLTAAEVRSSISATSGGGEVEDVAQDQHGALRAGQVLHRGDEGELDGCAGSAVRRSGLVGPVVDERLDEHRRGDPLAEVVGVVRAGQSGAEDAARPR